MKKLFILFSTVLVLAVSALAGAQTSTDDKIKELEEQIKQLQTQIETMKTTATDAQIEELKRQIQILAEEVEKLKSGEETEPVTDAERRALGLGPSAAKVYSKKQGVSIGGYGEVLFETFGNETQSGEPSEEHAEIDLLRAVLYFGYRFNDRFLFNSEVEFEHAGKEVSVEFAYIAFQATDAIAIRGGNVLIPWGF